MRVRRWLGRIFLMMFLSSIALWAMSYARFYYRAPSSLFATQRGSVQLLFKSIPWDQKEDQIAFRLGWHYMGYRGFATRWWVAQKRGADYWLIYVPLWIPTVLFGASFWYVYVPYRRHMRRKRLGQCLSCGYDLTGNESGVCPECGTKVETNSCD